MKQLFIIILFLQFNASAQKDSTWKQRPSYTLSGFADIYYVYDFNQPQGTARQTFLFNHNRHNAFNLNLGLIKLGVEHAKYRANIALQTGTYANDNYVNEPGVLKNINEANIGLSLTKKNKLWLDVGVLPSHIGFESAISSDNLTLTRSLCAENSPYFLSGAKLTYTPSKKWEMAALLVNGWQRIQRKSGNSLLSFGSQLTFTPTSKVTLNWSTFIGTDDPDISRRMRYFNNLYGQIKIKKRISLIAGFDIGMQQQFKGSAYYNYWFTPVLIGQVKLSEQWKVALRAEYFEDPSSVLIVSNPMYGFNALGSSVTIDYSPVPHLICRIEGRYLQSSVDQFKAPSSYRPYNMIVAGSIAIGFSEHFSKAHAQ